MKKSAKKVKAVKRSPKSSAPETEMPDLVAVMLKLTERLEAVEKKLDVVVSQTQPRQSFQQNQPRPQHVQHNQPQHSQHQSQPQQQHIQPAQQRYPQPQRQQPAQEQNFNRAVQPQHHHQNQNQNRQGNKPMYQAVCAECKKSCEVPFRPTGERPTFCKECYSKRKNGGHSGNIQQPNQPSAAPGFPLMEKRQLKVVSNGVGKTTISEMVPAAPRPASPAKKVSKPAKKAKR